MRKHISRRRFLSRSVALGTVGAGFPALPAAGEFHERAVPDPGSKDATSGENSIVLNAKEYFGGPGFAFLLFHNQYLGGMQGGLQMILNGDRILDSGDFYLVPRDGSQPPGLRALRRVVDRQAGTATVFGEIEIWNAGYRLLSRTDGKQISVQLQVDDSLDRQRISEAGLRIYIYPKSYFSEACTSDAGSCVFPRQYGTRKVLLGGAHQLHIAPSHPLLAFKVSRRDGTLNLLDNRERSPQSWFSIDAPLAAECSTLEIAIEPHIQPGWRRAPVIAVSQVGYHPNQKKCAVLELDPRDQVRDNIQLYCLTADGHTQLVKTVRPKPWGKFLHYGYALADFSEVRRPGIYFLKFRDAKAGPFKIGSGVYEQAWQPTLEYFLPIQMCHVEVVEGIRSWHGACHVDDASQAPPWTKWRDGYQQGAPDPLFAAKEHVPGLNWGGWHDAGDHDLPAGSIALTTLALALAQEEFSPSLDQTTIDRAARRVLLHVPNGRSDLLEQIGYGGESLLASYRVGGHIFSGIIETVGYSHLGDPVNITDNLVYDPHLKPGQVDCGRSGTRDDRWVFTNRNTGLQYQVAQTLAAASRVLRESNPGLAAECLEAARQLWLYEQNHAPDYWLCGYNPADSGFRCEEILATAELFLTTREKPYRDHLLQLLPTIESLTGKQFGEHWPLPPGWTLLRVLDSVDDSRFRSAVRERARQWRDIAREQRASNPHGVEFPPSITNPDWSFREPVKNTAADVWGYGWNLLWGAFRQYYYAKHLPGVFDTEPLLAALNYVLGCHPASNVTLVSGVGAQSPMEAYGFNRADWFSIPGGVISGPSLIKPDFMELKDFPFLWYQAEYVIHGAGAYIFTVLAADRLLNRKVNSGGKKQGL
jgi:endoglucanase